MNYNIHFYMPSLTHVTTDCIDYMSYVIITSDIYITNNISRYDDELHIMSISYI